MSKYNPEYAKEYRKRNRIKITLYQREYLRKYKKLNREKCKNWELDWDQKHRDYRAMKQRLNYYKHKKQKITKFEKQDLSWIKNLKKGEYSLVELQKLSGQKSRTLIERAIFRNGGKVAEFLDKDMEIQLLYIWAGYIT